MREKKIRPERKRAHGECRKVEMPSDTEREHDTGPCSRANARPLRVLRECLKIRARILAEISAELPHVRTAAKWAAVRARHLAHD